MARFQRLMKLYLQTNLNFHFMIVVTGAAGFIASGLVAKLNEENFLDIVLVDDFSRPEKERNYKDKTYSELVDRDNFFKWIDENHRFIQFIFHLGARTDTTCPQGGFPYRSPADGQ